MPAPTIPSWAHARRKFYEVHQATGSPVAAEALRCIAELYAIEATIRGQPAKVRQGVRCARSLPLVEGMKTWLEAELTQAPPRGGVADAIRYALTRWSALCRFLDDGRIELDNNTVALRMPGSAAMRTSMVCAQPSQCMPSILKVAVFTVGPFLARS